MRPFQLVYTSPSISEVSVSVFMRPSDGDSVYCVEVAVVYVCSRERFEQLVEQGVVDSTPAMVEEVFGQYITDTSLRTFEMMGINPEPVLVRVYGLHVVSLEDFEVMQ